MNSLLLHRATGDVRGAPLESAFAQCLLTRSKAPWELSNLTVLPRKTGRPKIRPDKLRAKGASDEARTRDVVGGTFTKDFGVDSLVRLLHLYLHVARKGRRTAGDNSSNTPPQQTPINAALHDVWGRLWLLTERRQFAVKVKSDSG